jgi:acetoin utilization protein AcuB
MIARELLTTDMIPLRTSNTGHEALGIMSDFYVRHLPIVNNEQLLGVISEDDILEHNADEPVGSYQLSLHQAYVQANAHLYEVMGTMSEFHLTVIPVVDDEGRYIGLISQSDLLFTFARLGAFSESGSILILDMNRRDYSLALIARIVESENASVLSSWILAVPDSLRVTVTLKLNRQDVQAIIAAFERFEIVVKASFQEDTYGNVLRERYESLISYLSI